MAKRKKTTKSQSEAQESSGIAGTQIPNKYKAALAKASKSAIGAQLWKPKKEGDAVAGKIISATWREGTYNPYCTLILDTADKSVMVRPGAVLVRQLQEQGTCVGAEVVLVYRGLQSFGRGRPATMIALEQVEEGDGDPIVDADHAKELEAARAKRSKTRAKGGKARSKR